MVRVAINGFGRIGRMVFRAGINKEHMEVVAVNDLTDTKTLAHLLKHDSVHGTLPNEIGHDDQHIIVDGNKIRVFAEKDPSKLPWKEYDVDVVVESTGFFRTTEKCQAHLDAGAKRVVISAPAKDEETKTIILGINEHELGDERIISMASCTSNCLAPLVKVLEDNFGIEVGYFNTIHAYTGDQRHVDGPHKDLRRARACAINIVPTTSGAAIAVEKAIPSVKGKVTGLAIRVPVPDGSITDLTCTLKKDVTVEQLNELFKNVAEHHLKGIMEYSEEPLVSTDIVGNTHSCVFDSLETHVLQKRTIKLLAWYDNEWGYSNRLVDLIASL